MDEVEKRRHANHHGKNRGGKARGYYLWPRHGRNRHHEQQEGELRRRTPFDSEAVGDGVLCRQK